MSPGPVTATAIFTGIKKPWSGTYIAIGHAIIEFPLIFLISLGTDKLVKIESFTNYIGLAGGLVLIVMAYLFFKDIKRISHLESRPLNKKPILAGIILTATNPYFLIWWTTIGLTLAVKASNFGIWAFALFGLTHWLCDCVWLTILSLASNKGTKLMGQKAQKIMLASCAFAILLFGIKFIADSLVALAGG